jgi:hypothetical protein
VIHLEASGCRPDVPDRGATRWGAELLISFQRLVLLGENSAIPRRSFKSILLLSKRATSPDDLFIQKAAAFRSSTVG